MADSHDFGTRSLDNKRILPLNFTRWWDLIHWIVHYRVLHSYPSVIRGKLVQFSNALLRWIVRFIWWLLWHYIRIKSCLYESDLLLKKAAAIRVLSIQCVNVGDSEGNIVLLAPKPRGLLSRWLRQSGCCFPILRYYSVCYIRTNQELFVFVPSCVSKRCMQYKLLTSTVTINSIEENVFKPMIK